VQGQREQSAGTQWSSVGAMENSMCNILYIALGPCQAVRAEAVLLLLPLPATRLLRQPMRASAQLGHLCVAFALIR
jgi:hypothetical protein